MENQNPDNQLQIELKEEVLKEPMRIWLSLHIQVRSLYSTLCVYCPGCQKQGTVACDSCSRTCQTFAKALEENIAKYERAFGPIRLQEDGVDTPPILDIKGEA